MPVSEREALVAYVDDLMKATTAGKIDWNQYNPTTFVWMRVTDPMASLALQRVESSWPKTRIDPDGKKVNMTEKTFNYILSVSSPGSMNVTISGQDDPRIKEKLGAIYEGLESGIVEKKLNFLRRTLPD
jgi:hypothetical protein